MGLEVKNPLRIQSKYDLLGSSPKTGKFLLVGHRSKKDVLYLVQNIKVPFGIGHSSPMHQT